nr:acyl-CoA dehydrogenase family protein [Streptomyces sp. DSM 41633]
NPERIMGAASAVGVGRFAINKAVDYVKTRQVWKVPIGSHQGLSHPLAQNHIEVELAKLMMQKAATLYDAGDDFGAAHLGLDQHVSLHHRLSPPSRCINCWPQAPNVPQVGFGFRTRQPTGRRPHDRRDHRQRFR